jgi:hypothetical protein
MKTFEAMAAESLAMADGQHKFPKLPSHWQLYYEKWKVNQAIRHLQLAIASGEVGKVQQALRKQRAMPSTPREHPEKVIEKLEMKLFVPPITATKQTVEAKTKTLQTECKCAFDPQCQCLASDCGGWTRKGCKYFGENGQRIKLYCTWHRSEKIQNPNQPNAGIVLGGLSVLKGHTFTI